MILVNTYILVGKNIFEVYDTYVSNGGKTATADNPSGTRINDNANVKILVSVGKPPAPAAPTPACPPCRVYIY